MKLLWSIMLVVIVGLQFRLWAGEGSFAEVSKLRKSVSSLEQANQMLEERNNRLDAQVLDLKNGFAAIEERARADLGMIARNETFFMVIDSP